MAVRSTHAEMCTLQAAPMIWVLSPPPHCLYLAYAAENGSDSGRPAPTIHRTRARRACVAVFGHRTGVCHGSEIHDDHVANGIAGSPRGIPTTPDPQKCTDTLSGLRLLCTAHTCPRGRFEAFVPARAFLANCERSRRSIRSKMHRADPPGPRWTYPTPGATGIRLPRAR